MQQWQVSFLANAPKTLRMKLMLGSHVTHYQQAHRERLPTSTVKHARYAVLGCFGFAPVELSEFSKHSPRIACCGVSFVHEGMYVRKATMQ